MAEINEHDRVVLRGALREEGLEAGDVGTVVHVYRAVAQGPSRGLADRRSEAFLAQPESPYIGQNTSLPSISLKH
jgi:uncharacterized protein DUF4926